MFFVSFSMILPSIYWLFEGHIVLKNSFQVSPSEKLDILRVLGTTVKDDSLAPPTDRSTGVHGGGFSHVLAVLWGSFRYLKSGSGDPAVFFSVVLQDHFFFFCDCGSAVCSQWQAPPPPSPPCPCWPRTPHLAPR